jgi:hypothetical protein
VVPPHFATVSSAPRPLRPITGASRRGLLSQQDRSSPRSGGSSRALGRHLPILGGSLGSKISPLLDSVVAFAQIVGVEAPCRHGEDNSLCL